MSPFGQRGRDRCSTLLRAKSLRQCPKMDTPRTRRGSAKKSLTQELLCQLVDVALVSGSSPAGGDDDHHDRSALDGIDDPIALTGGACAAEPASSPTSGLEDERRRAQRTCVTSQELAPDVVDVDARGHRRGSARDALLHHQPAVHVERRPGDVRGGVGREETSRRRRSPRASLSR